MKVCFLVLVVMTGLWQTTKQLAWEPISTSRKHMREGFLLKQYGSYRLFYEELLTWTEAFAHCRKWNAQLLVINVHGPENLALQKMIADFIRTGWPRGVRHLFHCGFHQVFQLTRIQTVFGTDNTFMVYAKGIYTFEQRYPADKPCFAFDALTYLVPVGCNSDRLPFMCKKCYAVPPREGEEDK